MKSQVDVINMLTLQCIDVSPVKVKLNAKVNSLAAGFPRDLMQRFVG